MSDKTWQDPITWHSESIHGWKCDPEEWHIATLKRLFKKGDPLNPTNWRGICLKDMIVRLTSSIFNARLIRVLTKHGIETQYGAQPG
jgi:hypothetical protein